MLIEEFLTNIFVYQAKIEVKGTDVILIESLSYPRALTQIIGDVLFTRFPIQKVYFFLANTLPLYTCATETGLVVNTGFLMDEVSPVVLNTFSKVGVKTSSSSVAKVD